jgi:hypothetical protein
MTKSQITIDTSAMVQAATGATMNVKALNAKRSKTLAVIQELMNDISGLLQTVEQKKALIVEQGKKFALLFETPEQMMAFYKSTLPPDMKDNTKSKAASRFKNFLAHGEKQTSADKVAKGKYAVKTKAIVAASKSGGVVPSAVVEANQSSEVEIKPLALTFDAACLKTLKKVDHELHTLKLKFPELANDNGFGLIEALAAWIVGHAKKPNLNADLASEYSLTLSKFGQ